MPNHQAKPTKLSIHLGFYEDVALLSQELNKYSRFNNLEAQNLEQVVKNAIQHIFKYGPKLGPKQGYINPAKRLDKRPGQDLSNCYSIYLGKGDSKEKRPFRIIWQENIINGVIHREILTLWIRKDGQVFDIAANRGMLTSKLPANDVAAISLGQKITDPISLNYLQKRKDIVPKILQSRAQPFIPKLGKLQKEAPKIVREYTAFEI